jgi:hypothetical protein
MDDFSDTAENVLVQLRSDAPNPEIRNVLRFYDTKKSNAQLRSAFQACSKSQLTSTLDYLGSPAQEMYVKESVVWNMICRIQNLLPEQCDTCKETYCIKTNEEPLLPCKSCGQDIHRPCLEIALNTINSNIQQLNTILQAIPGLHYICTICEQRILPSEGTLLNKSTNRFNHKNFP